MLINVEMTIANKCSQCGKFNFGNISFFKLLNTGKYSLDCQCGKSGIIMTVRKKSGLLDIKVPCDTCGCRHTYVINKRELLHDQLKIFYCPAGRTELCFAGRGEIVRHRIDILEKEMDDLADALGYEKYFNNTYVMFDSLNRIHDIAEKGNIYCECGCSDVDLQLFPDRILLKCRRCAGNKVIYASSNEHLKDTLASRRIILISGSSAAVISENR